MRAKVFVATVAVIVVALVGGLVARRAWAQPYPPAPAPMVRWQYTCLAQMSYRVWTPEVLNKLNEMGAQGWQLLPPRNVMANPDVYCFERRY